MNITFLWEPIILLFTGTLLLRFAGKKSMAKMTSLEVIVILAVGTTMGHAIKENKFWQIIIILTFFVIYLIFVQYLQFRSRTIERYLTGDATVVILNGEIRLENLKKLRLSKQQLEARLRQKGIAYISDVKTATIESDGGLGYELMEHAQPVTRKEFLERNNGDSNGNLRNNEEIKQDNIFNKVPHIK